MSKILNKVINSCAECFYSNYELRDIWFCNHMGRIIQDGSNIMNDTHPECQLPDAPKELKQKYGVSEEERKRDCPHSNCKGIQRLTPMADKNGNSTGNWWRCTHCLNEDKEIEI